MILVALEIVVVVEEMVVVMAVAVWYDGWGFLSRGKYAEHMNKQIFVILLYLARLWESIMTIYSLL